MVIALESLVGIFNLSASKIFPSSIAIFIPPLTEELSRLLSLFLGPPVWLYTAYMSGFEFLSYINLMSKDTSYYLVFSWEVYIRFIIVLCHFIWFGIQYAAYKIYEITDEKKYLFYGFLTTYMLHLLWNYKVGKIVYILIQEMIKN